MIEHSKREIYQVALLSSCTFLCILLLGSDSQTVEPCYLGHFSFENLMIERYVVVVELGATQP